MALAELVMVGGDHLLHLDELREDGAGSELGAVGEVPAPTTAGQLMRRLNRQCRLAHCGQSSSRQTRSHLVTAGSVPA